MLRHGSIVPLSWAMDGCITHHGTISSWQSAATSMIVKRCCSPVFSSKQCYIKYPGLFLFLPPGTHAMWPNREKCSARTMAERCGRPAICPTLPPTHDSISGLPKDTTYNPDREHQPCLHAPPDNCLASTAAQEDGQSSSIALPGSQPIGNRDHQPPDVTVHAPHCSTRDGNSIDNFNTELIRDTSTYQFLLLTVKSRPGNWLLLGTDNLRLLSIIRYDTIR